MYSWPSLWSIWLLKSSITFTITLLARWWTNKLCIDHSGQSYGGLEFGKWKNLDLTGLMIDILVCQFPTTHQTYVAEQTLLGPGVWHRPVIMYNKHINRQSFIWNDQLPMIALAWNRLYSVQLIVCSVQVGTTECMVYLQQSVQSYTGWSKVLWFRDGASLSFS